MLTRKHICWTCTISSDSRFFFMAIYRRTQCYGGIRFVAYAVLFDQFCFACFSLFTHCMPIVSL